MPLNQKGKRLIEHLSAQHGLQFHDLSDSGILHFSPTSKARLEAFKSTLRKYKLHYRLEKTKESEETGVFTMKIRTDRDHKLLKMQRQKAKINKNSKKPDRATKALQKPKAPGLLLASTSRSYDDKDIRDALGLSLSDWKEFQDLEFIKFLYMTIPEVLNYKELLDEVQWFFDKLHEHDLSNSYDVCIKHIEKLLDILAVRLEDASELDQVKEDLYKVQDEISKLHKLLRNICGLLLTTIRDESQRPVLAFIDDIMPYWSTISNVWTVHKEVMSPYFESYAMETLRTLNALIEDVDVVKKASVSKLIDVQRLLRKSSSLRMAEDLEGLIEKLKMDKFSGGQIPATKSVTGSWRVSLDDCPAPSLPTKYTMVTERSAYCKVKEQGKRCPSFRGIQGEYVLCVKAGSYKKGAFFSVIDEVKDKDVVDQLLEIAKEDNHVLLLFKKAEVSDQALYYARISDDRIINILESYPSHKRVSHYTYSVYYIAGEPVMVYDNTVICADKSILVELDKGTPMSKTATIKTAAVLRLTFTGNALRDTSFLDYFRSLNAVKFSEYTWDIPFKNEEDKKQILEDITKDFGYPIQVFQLVETLDKSVAPWTYDVMAMTTLAQTKLVPSLEYSVDAPKLSLSDKLYDISAQASEPKLAVLAANLRVAYHYVIALKEEVVEDNGILSVNHVNGTRVMTASGKVAELHDGSLLNIENGELLENDSIASISSHSVKEACDDNAIIIKILPEALITLVKLFKLPAPAALPPLVEPIAPLEPIEPDPSKLVTFSPPKDEFRPKITFLTADESSYE
jgi:hypothetical protein